MKRKIAAILAADVVGYSRLVADDEEETLRRLASYRSVFEEFAGRSGGRIFNTAGDSVLVEFPSAVEALRCAIDVQESLRTRNLAYPTSRQMNFRMGLTIGDVVESAGDLLGDGVNIAARLQTLARPGGICLSQSVFEAVSSKLSVKFTDMGNLQVKNIPNPIHAYGVVLDDSGEQSTAAEVIFAKLAAKSAILRHRPLAAALLGLVLIGAVAAATLSTGLLQEREAQSDSSEIAAAKPNPVESAAAPRATEAAGAAEAASPPSANASSPPPAIEAPKLDELAAGPSGQMATMTAPTVPSVTAAVTAPPKRLEDTAALERLRPIRWKKCTGEDTSAALISCGELINDVGITSGDLARAHRGLAYALRKKGDLDGAIASFTNSIEVAATAETFNDRGIAYWRKGLMDKALADYDHAIEIDGQNGDAFNNRAWAYFKSGRKREALADADKAVRLIPDKAYAWDTRGHIYEASGNRNSAIADFEKAILLDPTLDASKTALKRLTGK